MKLRFNSLDVVCGITELQSLIGLRVSRIYDIDKKTYLIRLQGGSECKKILLIESGVRFHTTSFEWPKNMEPSGFSMKLRKHLKNKRLEKLQQLGTDRIVDFQFGMGEAAYHIIAEFFDRGNIILTDCNMTILHVLRPHNEGEDIRFAVREKYPSDRAKNDSLDPKENEVLRAIETARNGDSLGRVIMPFVACGPSAIEHVLIMHNLNTCFISSNARGNEDRATKNSKRTDLIPKQQSNTKKFNIDNDWNALKLVLQEISVIMKEAKREVSRGFIIQNKIEKPSPGEGSEVENFYHNVEYHPYNFLQFQGKPTQQFETFMMAVDEFYSTLENQKTDMKTLHQEHEALKKLANIKRDHAKRIEELNKIQWGDKQKAELITKNQELVDNAILAIRSAVANQMSWTDIRELVKEAQANGDLVARAIKLLKLEINHITLILSDPYDVAVDGMQNYKSESRNKLSMVVDVDLGASAWANARKYYDKKRSAAQKEQKTLNASQKALKSAEKKTQQTLKEVRTISVISKARKVYWFEKFYWFISSENYLVIGGRDAQQNEIIVKRYMRPNDIYVHAEIQGASSVVVRGQKSVDVPLKTLMEAGTMAISYSAAWDAKVVTNVYWVRSDQVSKTAPTGEYLGTGSFMIRGKKNFLPSCNLVMGISLLFKLEESYIENHRGERKVRILEEEQETQPESKTKISLENENNCDVIKEEEGMNDKNNANQNQRNNCDVIKEAEGMNDKSNANQNQRNNFVETNNGTISEFPDIQVKVEHDSCGIYCKHQFSSSDVFNQSEQRKMDTCNLAAEEQVTLISAPHPRKKQQQNSKKRKEDTNRKPQKTDTYHLQNQQSISICQSKNTSEVVKRGQKGKLKKIKDKYKNQDDEERQLRMEILKSAGKINEVTVDGSENKKFCMKENTEPSVLYEPKQIQDDDLEDVDDILVGTDNEILDSLTGQPDHQDELLFVIPVVAPYQALQNYKYKLKLTPGTGKRGRAAKTTLTLFSKDKTSTTREKNLLKSVKEEALARNIPGKVKLSAPQLQKFKK